MEKVKLKIVGMHCASCAFNIDGELEDTEGVKESSTHYARQIAEVTYDPKRISLGKIASIIKGLGYLATPLS